MILVELSRTFDWNRYEDEDGDRIAWANYAPGIWYASFNGDFGLTDEAYWIPSSADFPVAYVLSVLIDNEEFLIRRASIAALFSDDGFYWDSDERLLYIKISGGEDPGLYDISVGRLQGFSDRGLVYVDGAMYMPIVRSVPAVTERQDLADYDELSFITGKIVFENGSGEIDDLIDETVYGNRVFIAHLSDDDIDEHDRASRGDLAYLAALYVEDYDVGIRRVVLNVADQRKALNVTIPNSRFNTTDYPNLEDELAGEVIPFIYGEVREAVAIPVTGAQASGAVSYKVASVMTALGSVYTMQDDVWTAVVPTSSDASIGEFTLAEADARNDSGGLFECKVVDCEGVSVTYASDVIKDLFERFIGIVYGATTYDTTEWEAEETALDAIGVVFDSPVKLYEAIRTIQNGANVGFRFEFLADGRRTIRVDDWSRTILKTIPNVDIKNLADLTAPTDSSVLAAEVVVGHSKSWESGKHLTYHNDSSADAVHEQYRQRPLLSQDSLLTSEADAADRADYLLERFSEVRPISEPVLLGAEYLSLRIYDIVVIEYQPGFFDRDYMTLESDRGYYGLRKAQVLGVAPDFVTEENKVRMVLIEEYVVDLRVTTGGDDRVTTLPDLRRLT